MKTIVFTVPAQADVRRVDREAAMRILTALHRFADTVIFGVLSDRSFCDRVARKSPDTVSIVPTFRKPRKAGQPQLR